MHKCTKKKLFTILKNSKYKFYKAYFKKITMATQWIANKSKISTEKSQHITC